ncbi:hypothetical protein BDF19DRAFT_454222 [Syncephalis fuscata]|nr:hypothetical protein BDF19DRAFT_454222 [Syncephalis fuscata]
MPAIDYHNDRDTAWMKHATRQWGISLHPSGEMSIDDYYMKVVDDIEQERNHALGALKHNIVIIIASCIFVRNFILSSIVIARHNRSIPAWCCWLASWPGVIFTVYAVLLILSAGVNCRLMIWSTWCSMPYAYILNNTILLKKAYLIQGRQKWILYVGILLLFPLPAFGFSVIFRSFITTNPSGFCVMHFPSSIPIVWFGLTIVINLFFSIMFCHVAYNQYRTFGSDAWKRLANDGIQNMCLISLCNIICCIFIIFQMAGSYTDTLLPLSW